MKLLRSIAGIVALLALALAARAQTVPEDVTLPGLPPALRGVGFDPQLDAPIPAEIAFRDETGRTVRFGDYYGQRPVVVALVYYGCPMLCNEVQQTLVSVLKTLSFNPGREYEVVFVSFDARETPEMAADKKKEAMSRFGRPETAGGWHFLTGSQASIDALTRAANFRYRFDEKSQLFAHTSGILLLTPAGRISRYFMGVNYPPRDVRLGLVDASSGKIGTPTDHVLLFCFQYDPASARYSATILTIIRAGGILTIFAILVGVVFFRWREHRAARLAKRGAGPNLQGAH
ncbi:MAG: SCO family protein [Acidobacteriia bacterium]|nr:SCO family protein [Terriglobia bacterium]